MAAQSAKHVSKADLIFQIELQRAEELGETVFRCPCWTCHGGKRFHIRVIRDHLRFYGRDAYLMYSMLGGNPEGGYPDGGMWVTPDNQLFPEVNVFDDSYMRSEYNEHLDPYHDVRQQVFDALDLGDRLHEEGREGDNTLPDMNAYSESAETLDYLYQESCRPVYEGVNVSVISATIVLINMAVVHGVTNAYLDELFKYLSKVLLPPTNKLLVSHYRAKKLVKKLGLNYNITHACPDGCVLFRGPHETLQHCPNDRCGKSRFIVGSEVIPARVVRHFPLIPRLLRMYRSPAISQLLQHHGKYPNLETGVMKSVVDSPAWKHVNAMIDPEFASKIRNLYFGLSLDGVNPFAHNSTSHSTWPVLILIYNLPPYLVTKNFFIQLSILISGKMSPTNKNIDVFISPFIEELQQLWLGVLAQDFSKAEGYQHFKMRGILLWTISDYPAYGLISGLCTHGYKGCTACGEKTDARSVASGNAVNSCNRAKGRKMVYGGSRRWTRATHPYRSDLQFNGEVERRSAPGRMNPDEVILLGEEREQYIEDGGRVGADNDPVHVHGVKRKSGLYALPYWKV